MDDTFRYLRRCCASNGISFDLSRTYAFVAAARSNLLRKASNFGDIVVGGVVVSLPPSLPQSMEANGGGRKQEVIGFAGRKDHEGDTRGDNILAGTVTKVIPAGKVLALHATVIYNVHYYENIEKSQVHHRYGAL